MEKEILNEERYKKINNVIRIIGFAVFIAGVILLAFGIVKLVSVPNYSGSDFLNGVVSIDQISDSHNETGVAIGMIAGGAFVAIAGIGIFASSFKRSIMAHQVQATMPVATEATNKYGQAVIPVIVPEIKKALNAKETEKCKNCGTAITKNAAFCSECGKSLMLKCSCGEINKSGSKFCKACGKMIK